jgi:hypothetical protein
MHLVVVAAGALVQRVGRLQVVQVHHHQLLVLLSLTQAAAAEQDIPLMVALVLVGQGAVAQGPMVRQQQELQTLVAAEEAAGFTAEATEVLVVQELLLSLIQIHSLKSKPLLVVFQ